MQRIGYAVYGLFVTCSVGCAATVLDDFHEALAADYADYWIAGATADERARRHSPEAFNGDVVTADVNGDGIDDFAAVLARAATDTDLQRLPERHRDLYDMVEVVVICNGTRDSSSYRCVTVAGPEPGGIQGELDLVDWGDRSNAPAGATESGNACAVPPGTMEDRKILSLLQPFGHCDTFFFPLTDGGYNGCTYCAD